MELLFLGGAREVGASCTLLTVAGHRILIDGGMRPAAREGQSRLPDLTLLDAAPPEALLITHAHIDHTGALPLLASLYPHTPFYATESTRVLMEILLRDSVRIMESEGLKPDGETPLYTAEQVDTLLARIYPVPFQQPFSPLPSLPALTVRYLPAGHILGAAMLFFETPEGTVLHTGDISVTDQRTIKGLDLLHIPHADLMICEGTYGSRAHSNRKEEERKLAETVQAVLARGGRILCPAFAVGRAQEVILILKAYRASGQVSPVPIYLDGMVRTVCMAYQSQSHDLHPNLQRALVNARRPLFADPDLQIFSVRSRDRPALIDKHTPMIVISSSGMLTGGASPFYAASMAAREQDCLLFTGYQDEESPGAALLKAQSGDLLRLGDQRVTLACQVARYNLSGHADGEQIVHVVTKVAPKRLILVHGAPEALEALAKRFPNIAVDLPAVGATLIVTSSRTSVASTVMEQDVPTTTFIPQEPTSILPPTIEALWDVAHKRGPLRPWTAVELGQQYYGPGYHPSLRAQVEGVLREASAFFKIGRVGAQPTYLPRSISETISLRSIASLPAGEIVLVQGNHALPQIAVLLSAPQEGTVSLVGDQWKAGVRPMNLIQLLPQIHRVDLLTYSAEEARQHLRTWHSQLDAEWVDLFSWWDRCRGQTFTYSLLCKTLSSEDLRLAWGLELLTHGDELFSCDGLSWTPVEEEVLARNPGFLHHLDLLRAGEGTRVVVKDRYGTLTGRSTWRFFEIRWEDEKDSEYSVRVRSANIQILSQQ